ncbi:hypothetical protein L2E82_31152 [Cichorium intybus]|uniref:Uncharacterized protein n=1 Tax=Cichorium intybus TaxID=13427 RepID=A0ACB9D319_CICIN|nr:hypothetical protein L2E82_31152 [Cichorium intybus]
MFTDLQSARKESRGIDVAVLEEQVNQMLKEWKNELDAPSPASSLQQGASFETFPPDISKLLQLCEEEDDATSGLAAPKPDPDALETGENVAFHTNAAEEQNLKSNGQSKGSPSGIETELDYFSFDYNSQFGQDDLLPMGFLPNISPPPSAFLGPKCALWDCPRPAQGWCPDYCSSLHAAVAQTEGCPGMKPVIRPKGIELKDNLLFAALSAKSQGKNVGVPECEGAATTKSPWNAPELFDMSVFEGETIREWLFFDKPRRAFESGNRKQRSLPDYNGRGWHESRKQVINDSGWLKRSYYMDPQPMKSLEWHLFEYEITKCDACALYRLELKLVNSKKGKTDSVSDLQKQMKHLTAEAQSDGRIKRSVKPRGKSGAPPPVADLGGYHLT